MVTPWEGSVYRIVVDRAHSLIRLDMEGMLTPAEADRLVADLIARITAERLNSYVLIIDVSRCPVHPLGGGEWRPREDSVQNAIRPSTKRISCPVAALIGPTKSSAIPPTIAAALPVTV